MEGFTGYLVPNNAELGSVLADSPRGVPEKYLDRFCRTNFQERFPFVLKVMRAYISAMLTDSDCSGLVERIQALFDPHKEMMIFNELHPTAASFSDPRYRHIFSYSIQRKDIYLFQMIADAFALGGVETRYGPYLYSEVVQWTDPVVSVSTDEGYTTDMVDSNFPVSCIMLDFAPGNTGGLPTFDEVWERFMASRGLITLLKPARQPMALIRRVGVIYSFFQKRLLDLPVDILAGYRSQITTMSDEDIRDEYLTCQAEPAKSVHVTSKSLSPRVRQFTCFADSRPSGFSIAGYKLPSIQFNVDWPSDVFGDDKNYGKYCFQMILNLSNLPSNDVFPQAVSVDIIS